MKDYLQDIVQHTHGLGFIDLVKVDGTDEETILEGLAEDRSVIIKAKFKNLKLLSLASHERSRIAGIKKVNEFKDGFLILISILKLLIFRK